MIISGFPLIGKSTLSQKDPSIIDLESSIYYKGDLKGYIEKIIRLDKSAKMVLISSHKEVRLRLQKLQKQYIFIRPSNSDKQEYLKRSKDRQPHKLKTKVVEKNWEYWRKPVGKEVVGWDIWELRPSEYIESVITPIKHLSYLDRMKI